MITFTHCAFMAKQACATCSKVVQEITPPIANNFLKFFFALFATLALNAATAWGAEVTYVMYPDGGSTFNSEWNKTSRTAKQTYASKVVVQMMGVNGGVYGEITSKTTVANINAISVKCTANNAQKLTLYYSTNNSQWTELSTTSISKNTSSYSDYDIDIAGIPATAYIKFRAEKNSIYLYSITISTSEVATPVDPAVTFSNGSYTVGGSVLDLSTLWTSDSDGAVTYSIVEAGTTGASINGTSFTATAAGTCTVKASQTATSAYNAITKTATITVTAPPPANPYKVTLEAGPGTCVESVTEASAGAGVTLPTPTLDCGDWEFAGWATSSVTTKTTSKPEILLTGEYNPTANITLYAVYQRTEETEGSNEESKTITLSPPTTTSGYKEGTKTDSEGNTWSYYAAINNQSGTLCFGLNSNSLNYNIGSPAFDGKVSFVSFKAWNGSSSETRKFLFCSTNTIAQPTTGDLAEVSIPKSQQFTETYTADLSQSSVSQFYIYAPKALGITAISVTYTTSTTYYHSTPECAAPCTDFVTIRKGTSDNGSFNLDKTGEQSTCNGAVTVTLSDIQPDAGYKFSAITQTGVDASKVTIDNTAKTVTYAKNTTGTSTINVTFEQIPRLAKPTNLKVSSVSCANASLTWDAVDGTNKYKLVLTNTSKNTQTTSNLNTNSAFITLSAGVTYSWTIQAIGNGTTNTDSEVATGENFITHYTITYNTNGGSDVEDGCGTTLPETLPTTTKNHYTFDGWYLDENFTTQAEASATLTKNTDLYAKWTANTYTITFKAGTGTCGTESATATHADGITLPTAAPSDVCDEVGWTFAGWAEAIVTETTTEPTLFAEGTNYKPAGKCTLYAVYSTTAETTGFTGYEKVTEEPEDWSGKYLLSTGTYTATGAFDSNRTSGHLVRETYTPGTEEKANWEFTLAKVGNTGYSILFPDGSSYLGYASSTNFACSAAVVSSENVAYLWTPSTSGITNVSATSRKIADNGSADFRPYSSPSSGIVYLYKRIGGGAITTYNSNPDCTPPSEYTITWWANGEEYYTQTAVEGTAIDVPTNSPNAATYACDDKVFVGWVDTEIIGSTDTKPTLITDFDKITENKDFFAVFATEEGEEETTTKVFETGEIGKNGNSITSGYVLIAQASAEEGYYQDGTGGDKRYIQVSKVDKATPMMLSNPSSVVIKANLGGGSTKKLTNPVYAVWLDVNGDEMGNAVIVTDEITNKTGSDFIVSLPVANATEAYGIRVYHQKESGYNVRYYGISLSYTYNTTTYSGYVTTCEKPTYTRVVKPGEYGTICLPYGSSDYTGAEFYEVSSVEYGKGLWLDQLPAGTALAAGKPYIFRATAEKLVVVYQGEKKDSPVDGVNGLTGTFTAIAANSTLVGHYIIALNQIWVANDKNTLPAYRAYIKNTVPTTPQAQIPGRRRVCMGENAATGFENVTNGENTTIKVIENGQLFIIRNGEKYNIQGQKL